MHPIYTKFLVNDHLVTFAAGVAGFAVVVGIAFNGDGPNFRMV